MNQRKQFETWFKSVNVSPHHVAEYEKYFTLDDKGQFLPWGEQQFKVWNACQNLNDRALGAMVASSEENIEKFLNKIDQLRGGARLISEDVLTVLQSHVFTLRIRDVRLPQT